MRNPCIGFSLGFLTLAAVVGCNDPKDPQTWIKRLRDPQYASEAVSKLQEMKDPVAVKPLCELFEQYQSANILKAIASFKHPDSIPTLLKALEISDVHYHNASIAAAALADMNVQEAVAPLTAMLKQPVPIQSRANVAKLAAIDALGQLKNKESIPALIEVAHGVPEEQDFLLNKRAIEVLGEFAAPEAIPVLIRGLFMSSTIQGTSFPQARVALVRVGPPAVPALVAVLHGKDKSLNEMAQKLEFAPGVMLNKAAIVLGDMMATAAVPDLISELKAGNASSETLNGVVEALGKINDPRAIDPLVALVGNKKAHSTLRAQAATALTLIEGSEKAAASLLSMASTAPSSDQEHELRGAGAMAYSRITVGKDAAGMAQLNKMAAADQANQAATANMLKESVERAELAKACGSDVACYAGKLNDENVSLAQREKAGLMLGRLKDGRQGLDALVNALPTREPILRLVYLETAKRIGTGKDAALLKTLTELAEKDSKRQATFLGGDLASADKIALAVIQRK